MKYTKYSVKRTLPTRLGWSYENIINIFKDLIFEMYDKIGKPLIDRRKLRFVVSFNLYNIARGLNEYMGIRILLDPSLDAFSFEIIKLIYEDEDEEPEPYWNQYCAHDAKSTFEFWANEFKSKNKLVEEINSKYGLTSSTLLKVRPMSIDILQEKPHIDHVIFNGPATIVFWKDGTKTVVKHDGKGRKDKRQAILYAFIRKIYGEGKSYHNILNEIEEAIK